MRARYVRLRHATRSSQSHNLSMLKHAKGNASEASAKYSGVENGVCEHKLPYPVKSSYPTPVQFSNDSEFEFIIVLHYLQTILPH